MGNAASAMSQFGLSAVSMGMDWNDQENQGNAAEGMANRNARLLREAEVEALNRGEANAGQVRLKAGMLKGQQRAAMAASGVDIQGGDAMQVFSDSAAMSEYDAQMVRANAAREAWGYASARAQVNAQSSLDKMKVNQAKQKTILGGFSGMLSSAGGGMGGGQKIG